MQRLEAGERVSAICREFGVSRTMLYTWVQRYTQASGEQRQAALASRRPRGQTHYRYAADARQMVLDIVRAAPHLSIRQIQQELVKRAGSRALSRHGVHCILRAYQLNSREERAVFAAAHQQANDVHHP